MRHMTRHSKGYMVPSTKRSTNWRRFFRVFRFFILNLNDIRWPGIEIWWRMMVLSHKALVHDSMFLHKFYQELYPDISLKYIRTTIFIYLPIFVWYLNVHHLYSSRYTNEIILGFVSQHLTSLLFLSLLCFDLFYSFNLYLHHLNYLAWVFPLLRSKQGLLNSWSPISLTSVGVTIKIFWLPVSIDGSWCNH